MSKQSAVEFLLKELNDILGPIETQPIQDLRLMEAIDQARQMHIEQTTTAYLDGCYDWINKQYKGKKQYYIENYKVGNNGQTVTICNHLSSPKTSEN